MTPTTIKCPHCSEIISIDEALSHQVSAQLQQDFEQKLLQKQQELQLQAAKQIEAARLEATSSLSKELGLAKEQLEAKEKKLAEAREQELLLRKKQLELEDDKKAFELEKQRQLDLERGKIKAEAEKQASEVQQLKMLEMQKQLSDAIKANEEMRRKLQQGSQQTQGEVLELELEEALRKEFPMDEIQPVSKGIRGADVLQIVKDRQGRACGSILWELKNAQWSEKWLEKLKEDQRTSKASVAVLVSIQLPETITTFSYVKGVWVCSKPLAMALASALRIQLNQVFTSQLAAVGKNEKMDYLFTYLSGNEFQQRVEAIVGAFQSMQEDLEREKNWYTKKWAKQEKNLRRVIDHTLGMHGDLESIMGASLPEIKQLQLESGDE